MNSTKTPQYSTFQYEKANENLSQPFIDINGGLRDIAMEKIWLKTTSLLRKHGALMCYADYSRPKGGF
jgi:hypothetical protein